ncbi:MAG: TetR/AcrR family transcriptional regulator [Gammaproteobacteria bacterium]|nr:TetR/AcrR family transcriptional regulator [Gammaproteobacteria bacterium]MBU1625633.1 TetR/AcrR family transcriptional regulator [Gammaproteobacteria bacterium]MBU1980893.1 TetR/AcrR family transcriptional regulator [Gammaproteobacteria bacterium]
MAEYGKRALNKAQTRLDILNASYRMTDAVNFRDLKVKDIAQAVGITEMTFFNYFAKKEDILRYMMGIWTLDIFAQQLSAPLAGEAAIRRVFSHAAQQVKQYPRMMVSFIAYIVTNEISPEADVIEAPDRYLRYPEMPELYEAIIPSGNEILMQHLAEIDPSQDHMDTLLQLASCFYGDVLVAHTAGMDIEMLYTKSLDLILGRIKG